jgi:NAD(P)-dependent dehydrogenase (short-subunit alcohol dehydrogenase family)
MRTAVTGHSGGLGKVIADRLAKDGHEIVGFSLDNGYDLSTDEGFRKIVVEALDCDVFVNCAHDRKYHGVGQTAILVKLFYHWQDQEKHIITIGSDAPDHYSHAFVPFASRYRAAKSALDAACLEIQSLRKPCRVSMVRPGWLNSELAKQQEKDTGVKIDTLEYHEVADIVASIVNIGPEITIQSVTLARTVRRSEEPDKREPGKPRSWWGRRV